MSPRNEKGQFLETTGNSRYRNVQYNGIRMGEHSRSMCIQLGLDKIPDGFVVHHLDQDKKNNSIDNLALVTITAHNRIHSHSPWNKGLTLKDKKWSEAHQKGIKVRFSNHIKTCKETSELQSIGKTLREISIEQGISRRQVSDRIKRYKQYVKSQWTGESNS